MLKYKPSSYSLLLLPGRQISSSKRYFFKVFKRNKDNEDSGKAIEGQLEGESSNKMSPWSHLSEEEINNIRDKSRLPKDVWCELNGVPEHGTKFEYLKLYKRDSVRSYFAKYGEASGLKPGVCWPSVQELEFKIKFEKSFYPSFDEMVQGKKKLRKEEAENLKKYRENILKNLSKLPEAKKSFFSKLEEIEHKKEEERKSREKLVQDVREFLGYDVSPADERFADAVSKMEEIARASKKGSKKQEKQAKLLAQLASLADEEIKKAQLEEQKPSEEGQK